MLRFDEPFPCPVCGQEVTLVSAGQWRGRIRTHRTPRRGGGIVPPTGGGKCAASRSTREEADRARGEEETP